MTLQRRPLSNTSQASMLATHRQTDRQTDRHRYRLKPPLSGEKWGYLTPYKIKSTINLHLSLLFSGPYTNGRAYATVLRLSVAVICRRL